MNPNTEISQQEAQWQADKIIRKEAGEQRRESSASIFADAVIIASEYDMVLLQRSCVHYQLLGMGWTLNIYPGNQRLYSAPSKPHPPFLGDVLPVDWNVKDVVVAVVKHLQSKRGK